MGKTTVFSGRGFSGLGKETELPGKNGGSPVRVRSGGAVPLRVCKNLTVEDDGTLTVRRGFTRWTETEEAARAVVCPGGNTAFLLASDTVLRVDPDGEKSGIGTVENEEGEAEFAVSYGRTWLSTGAGLYEVNGEEETVTSAVGYAPLIGKEWRCGAVGDPCEAENLVSPYVRITYDAGDSPSQYLATGRVFSEVTAVFVNGVRRSPSTYVIDPELATVNVTGISAHDRILLCGRYADAAAGSEDLWGCRRLSVFGGSDGTRLCAFGPEDGRLFLSSPVPAEEAGRSEEIFGGCGSLYFPVNGRLTVGDGTGPVKAVLRAFGRMLVLTGREAWLGDGTVGENGESPSPLLRVKEDFGSDVCGAAVVRGVPYVLCRRNLFAADTYRTANDDVRLTSVASFSARSFSGLYYDRPTGRLWSLFETEEGKMGAFVCDTAGGRRSEYRGLPAGKPFDLGDGTGILAPGGLYRLEGDTDGGAEIEGEARTYPEDFGNGDPDALRRVRSLFADTAGGKTVTLSAETDGVSESKSFAEAEGTVCLAPALPYGHAVSVGFLLSAGESVGGYRLSVREKERVGIT